MIERAIGLLNEGKTLVAISVDDFFEGNTDERSIGVNLSADKHIGLAGFRAILDGIRNREDVQDVYIELHEIPDPDDEEDMDLWPVGWVIFIITSAPLTDVRTWLGKLHPRDVSLGWSVQDGIKVPVSAESMPMGMHVVRAWLG